jgi:hypothetical protein
MKANPLTRQTPKLSAYGIKKPSPSVEEMLAIKQAAGIRLTASPFTGNYEDIVFPGRSAPWKGVKGIAGVRAMNAGVAEGLDKAITISRACRGVTGVRRVGNRWLPNKAICEIEKSGHREATPA